MIKLGEGWIAEGYRIFHECGPNLRIELLEGNATCDCGILIPRRVRHFAEWLSGGRPGLLIDALLLDGGLIEIDDPSEPQA